MEEAVDAIKDLPPQNRAEWIRVTLSDEIYPADTTSKHAIAIVNIFKQRAHIEWLYQRNNLLGTVRKTREKVDNTRTRGE